MDKGAAQYIRCRNTPPLLSWGEHVEITSFQRLRACCTEKRLQLYGCIAQYGAFWNVTPATMTSVQLRNSSIDGLHRSEHVQADSRGTARP